MAGRSDVFGFEEICFGKSNLIVKHLEDQQAVRGVVQTKSGYFWCKTGHGCI